MLKYTWVWLFGIIITITPSTAAAAQVVTPPNPANPANPDPAWGAFGARPMQAHVAGGLQFNYPYNNAVDVRTQFNNIWNVNDLVGKSPQGFKLKGGVGYIVTPPGGVTTDLGIWNNWHVALRATHRNIYEAYVETALANNSIKRHLNDQGELNSLNYELATTYGAGALRFPDIPGPGASIFRAPLRSSLTGGRNYGFAGGNVELGTIMWTNGPYSATGNVPVNNPETAWFTVGDGEEGVEKYDMAGLGNGLTLEGFRNFWGASYWQVPVPGGVKAYEIHRTGGLAVTSGHVYWLANQAIGPYPTNRPDALRDIQRVRDAHIYDQLNHTSLKATGVNFRARPSSIAQRRAVIASALASHRPVGFPNLRQAGGYYIPAPLINYVDLKVTKLITIVEGLTGEVFTAGPNVYPMAQRQDRLRELLTLLGNSNNVQLTHFSNLQASIATIIDTLVAMKNKGFQFNSQAALGTFLTTILGPDNQSPQDSLRALQTLYRPVPLPADLPVLPNNFNPFDNANEPRLRALFREVNPLSEIRPLTALPKDAYSSILFILYRLTSTPGLNHAAMASKLYTAALDLVKDAKSRFPLPVDSHNYTLDLNITNGLIVHANTVNIADQTGKAIIGATRALGAGTYPGDIHQGVVDLDAAASLGGALAGDLQRFNHGPAGNLFNLQLTDGVHANPRPALLTIIAEALSNPLHDYDPPGRARCRIYVSRKINVCFKQVTNAGVAHMGITDVWFP